MSEITLKFLAFMLRFPSVAAKQVTELEPATGSGLAVGFVAAELAAVSVLLRSANLGLEVCQHCEGS